MDSAGMGLYQVVEPVLTRALAFCEKLDFTLTNSVEKSETVCFAATLAAKKIVHKCFVRNTVAGIIWIVVSEDSLWEPETA